MASVLSAGTTSNTALNLSADTTGILQFQTNGTTAAMTLDTSQNVGIGVTPSAWRSTNKALQIGQSAAIFGYTASNIVGLSTNSYIDSAGNEKYITNGTGGSYFIGPSSGEHRWSIFPNNTSGPDAALTPTEVMRITSAGNVGIGTSSPATKLQISESGAGPTVTLNRLGDTSGNAVIRSTGSTGTINASITLGGGSDNLMTFATGSTASERMRIDSSGNVGIGETTAGSYRLNIKTGASAGILLNGTGSGGSWMAWANNGTINSYLASAYHIFPSGSATDFGIVATNNLIFGQLNAERMRITSAGYFKASNDGDYAPEGSTSTVHQFCQTSNSVALSVVCRNTGQSGDTVRIESYRNTTNNSFYFMGLYNRTANAFKLQIADSGNVTNTNGSYGTISDAKNKENIVDATPKLNKVNQLKVRNFNFKGDDLKQIGFVAQEFEQVFPSMVEEHHDKDADGNDLGTTTKSIKTSVLVPILVKAIQEQQAMIETLQAEVAALKGVN